MSLTKYLVQQSFDMGLGESLRLAQTAQELARRSEDHKEAVSAFLALSNKLSIPNNEVLSFPSFSHSK